MLTSDKQTDNHVVKAVLKKFMNIRTTNCVLWVKAALIKHPSLNVRQLMAGHFPTHESAQ